MSKNSTIKWSRLSQRIDRLIPSFLRPLCLPEESSILSFVKKEARQLPASSLVLDAGSGSAPYRSLFENMHYQTTDFPQMFNPAMQGTHDFLCDLASIPKPDNTYDAILNTQVLEHVPDPRKVLSEFYRILKPGGILLLSAPQGWGIHGEPYHFFNFTYYGLELLFKNANFDIDYITPRGGIFNYLAERIRTVPRYIFDQHCVLWNQRQISWSAFKLPLLLPLFVALEITLGLFAPLLLSIMDSLDKRKSFTLGYACRCTKGHH